MGMLDDYTKAKFSGASTDNSIKYSAAKAFFSAEPNTNKQSQAKYTDRYYSDNQKKEYFQKKQQKDSNTTLETVPLEYGELEELKKPLIFDDSNLYMNFMKEAAKKDFNSFIGIYNTECIVRINTTQEKYLFKYVKALLACKTEQEMRNIQKVYISNTGLFYLKYFSNFSFSNGVYPVKIHLERILKMKINLTI